MDEKQHPIFRYKNIYVCRHRVKILLWKCNDYSPIHQPQDSQEILPNQNLTDAYKIGLPFDTNMYCILNPVVLWGVPEWN